jgi:hypothetical protein
VSKVHASIWLLGSTPLKYYGIDPALDGRYQIVVAEDGGRLCQYVTAAEASQMAAEWSRIADELEALS